MQFSEGHEFTLRITAIVSAALVKLAGIVALYRSKPKEKTQ